MSLCQPFWKLHRWSAWAVTRRVQQFTQYVYWGERRGESYYTGNVAYQERQCERCGLRQSRSMKA